jgi:YHS domain-containing protein
MKIFILLALVVVLYYLLKGFFRSASEEMQTPGARPDTGRAEGRELVKDPYCQTYIPMNVALRTRIEGEDHFFCSEECMKRYVSERKRESAQAG